MGKYLTEKWVQAMEEVCGECAYICENRYDAIEQAGYGYTGGYIEPGEKFCDRCMVCKTYMLHAAIDEADSELSYDSPEWQSIINY